jgi:hypothetical protein
VGLRHARPWGGPVITYESLLGFVFWRGSRCRDFGPAIAVNRIQMSVTGGGIRRYGQRLSTVRCSVLTRCAGWLMAGSWVPTRRTACRTSLAGVQRHPKGRSGDPGRGSPPTIASFHEPIDPASAPPDTYSERDSTSVADEYAQ